MTLRKLAALAVVALASGVAVATQVRFVPVPERVAVADLVALGTVTGIEEDTIEAEHFRVGKTRLKVATVRVTDRLLGKSEDTIRVAFEPLANQPIDGR